MEAIYPFFFVTPSFGPELYGSELDMVIVFTGRACNSLRQFGILPCWIFDVHPRNEYNLAVHVDLSESADAARRTACERNVHD